MRRGFFISLIFHATLTIIAYFGIPYLEPEPLISDTPIFVEVVNAADQSNPAPLQPEPKEKSQKVRELKVLRSDPVAEIKPEAVVKPNLEVAELVPETLSKPDFKPEYKLKAAKRPKPQLELAGVRPPKKPKPPDAFESVLKTLEALEKAQPKLRDKSKKIDSLETGFEEAIEVALKSNSGQKYNPNLPVSISETDAIRKHFQRCWNVPAGAKGAESMIVELEINFLQDGSVRSVQILDSARMRIDSFFKITAEAAQRAVLHPKCNKLSMSPDRFPKWQSKYQRWQKMTLVFDPKDMF